MKFRCANCETVVEFPSRPKKFICPECGAPNTPTSGTEGTGAGACDCILPTGFEWREPAGVIFDGATYLFKSPDDGKELTRDQWIQIYGYDPQKRLEYMRKLGKEGVPGFKNLSTLGKKK